MWAQPSHHPQCACRDCVRSRVEKIAGDLHRYIEPANISTSYGEPDEPIGTQVSISTSFSDEDMQALKISSDTQIDSILSNYEYSMLLNEPNVVDWNLGGRDVVSAVSGSDDHASKIGPGLGRGNGIAGDEDYKKMEEVNDEGNAYGNTDDLDDAFARGFLAVVMGVMMGLVLCSGVSP
jgi:hypothetical protein